MARPTWSGYISFGLVTVPVKLYTAVRSHDVHFRQLHEDTLARVKRKRVDAKTGDEVPYDEIVKGYEVAPGEYVVVDPDELAQLDPEASRRIDIRDFVDLADIDPIYYDRPYYLAPADESAQKPYRLLVEAMDRAGKVAIAKFVMRTKEYLAAIRPKDGWLLLSTMNYADEVIDTADLDEGIDATGAEVNEREVAMAEQLIDSLVTDFDPTSYRDEYQERVLEFLDRKAEGQEVHLEAEAEEPGRVVDLMAALEQSLRGGRPQPADRRPEADYDEMTKDELYERAQELDVPGRSNMSKAELIEAVRERADGGRRVAS